MEHVGSTRWYKVAKHAKLNTGHDPPTKGRPDSEQIGLLVTGNRRGRKYGYGLRLGYQWRLKIGRVLCSPFFKHPFLGLITSLYM